MLFRSLMGDGVNIAARLGGIAKPGAICLSEQAYWQVKGRLDLAVTDLGTQRELPFCINSLAAPRRGLKPDGDRSAAAPAATRSHAS